MWQAIVDDDLHRDIRVTRRIFAKACSGAPSAAATVAVIRMFGSASLAVRPGPKDPSIYSNFGRCSGAGDLPPGAAPASGRAVQQTHSEPFLEASERSAKRRLR